MQPYFAEPLPPYIEFDRRSIEKRRLAPPEGDGSLYYEQVDYIIVTPQGSKDKTERVWGEYEPYLKDLVKKGQFPPKWLEAYQYAFKEWASGRELPVEGTPVRNWPVLSSGEVKALTSAKIRTVEELAQANESQLASIGMGARSLKQRAQDWVTAKQGVGGLIETLDATRRTNESLLARVNALEAQNTKLVAQAEARQPVGQPVQPVYAQQPDPAGHDEGRLDADLDMAMLGAKAEISANDFESP